MDPDYPSPPPAYSEQEFDQKISQATTLSLHTSQVLTNIDPDGWPQYDPTAFESTFTSEGSSSSPTTAEPPNPFPMETLGKKDDYMEHGIVDDLPSVVPLRIEKKRQQNSNLAKPSAISQPRNESSSLTINENPSPTLFCPATSDRNDFRLQSRFVQSTCAEDDVSLTAAVPVHSTQIPNHERGASLTFEAQSPARPSLPAQPFVYDNHYQHHVNPYSVTPSQPPKQYLPVRFIPQERPMISYPPSPDNFQSSYVPRLDFNPSIAYGKTQPVAPSPPLQQPVKIVQYDPHAFYNSAVSAQITPITTGQHGHSSYNSRNSFSPQKQYLQQGSPATYSRPGHYSQSSIPQDPLSLERSSPPFGVNSSRQSILQSPARPSSSYSMSSNYQTFNSPSPANQFVNHTANVPSNMYYDQQSAEYRWSTQ